MRENAHIHYSSHLPLLIKMVSITDGDVLELGTGIFSTPVLHWMCVPDERNLVSYEGDKKYYELAKQYSHKFHTIHFAEEFDDIEIEKPWDVVFIDHEVHEVGNRSKVAKKVANYAKFVILHDTCWRNRRFHHYEEIYPLFKYRYQFQLESPKTTVVSNFVDVNELGLWK